jgi:photosystem II stability/assembly factor-like uncharacterized protein
MKRNQASFAAAFGAVALTIAGGLLLARSVSGAETTVAALAKETHFHGIAVDAKDASRIYLATHHGLFLVRPDGKAEQISRSRDDFMGFTPHPSDPNVLFASGHPASGGNLGFITSTDGGVSWRKLSDGIGGPVDFHNMDVSAADPQVIYGTYRDLQKSTDGGRSWTRVGPPPDGLIALAASSRNSDTLYAATQRGLLRSTDGGKSWSAAHLLQRPATTVHVTRDGTVYAFLVGTGLVRAKEQDLRWETASNGFGTAYVLHLAVAPNDGRRVYAVTFDPETRSQAVLATNDGGARWARLGTE